MGHLECRTMLFFMILFGFYLLFNFHFFCTHLHGINIIGPYEKKLNREHPRSRKVRHSSVLEHQVTKIQWDVIVNFIVSTI